MNHEEIREQLPLYVLGGLDPETTAAVEQHLAGTCDACAADMREWQEIVGLIPLGVTPVVPGDRVKNRLMARVRQDARAKATPLRPHRWRAAWMAAPLAAAAILLVVIGNKSYQDHQRYLEAMKAAAEQTARAETAAALLAHEQQALADREAKIQQLSSRLQEQQLAAEEKARQVAQLEAALAQRQAEVIEQRKLVKLREQELARVRSAGSTQQTQLVAYENEIAALKADLARQRELAAGSEREVKELRAALDQQKSLMEASVRETEQLRAAVARQRGIIEVLTSPGLHLERLQKAKLGVSSQGHVLWNERTKTWVFYAFNMPQPPPGKEYQVWFMTEKEGPVSAGLFTPDQSGTGVVLAKPPSKLFGEIVAAAVTLEPAGGLPKPSGEMYLRGSL